MAIEMFSIITSLGHSLRYEITFAAALIIGWCIAKLASIQQKPRRSGKLSPRSPTSNKASSPASQERRAADYSKEPLPTPSSLLGRIDDIAPALLRDPAWLLPQATHMCRTQVRQAVLLYNAGLAAGLKLEDVPAGDCQQFFVSLITAAVRAGQMDDAMQILKDLRKNRVAVSSALFCSVVKLCTSKQLYKDCLAFYDLQVEDPAFKLTDKTGWSCLLFCAVEARAYARCSHFFDHLRASGTPSQKDYGNMTKLASLQGDWQLALKLLREMRDAAIAIDSIIFNTALATCISANQVNEARGLLTEMEGVEGLADVITYNTLMKGYSKSGSMDKCFEIFEHLKSKDIAPSQITYGILLDGFINENQPERAAQIFNTMSSEGGTMNTVLFTTLIKGFARAGEVDQAMKVYEQMRGERNVCPDLITFSILIKANCDDGRLEGALQLLEAMANLNLRPDEVVFNNLLSGCARQGNVQLGKRLYQDMVASGVRPSNATFSILIRFYHQCKILEDAVELLKTEPAKHNVDPEPRLFLQLIQSCIRERQGRRAVEVYEMMVQRSSPSAATHSSMMTTCTKLNMFDTASEILVIAAAKNFRVDARDANALLDSAVRKRKMQVAQDIAGSIQKLRLRVEPKLLASVCQ